jgi:hypothetical protein
MNLQAIEYTRVEVRHALLDLSGGTKGQLQAFSEHPPADKNKSPRRNQNVIELEGGEGCGRSFAKALTTPVYVLETRSRRRAFPPIQDLEFHYAPWRRVINSLEEYQQAWIRYCYGFDLNFKYQTLMCQHVWNEFQNCQVERKLQSRVVKKLLGLVWLAAQEVAATRNNDTYREYAGAALARMMSVDRSTWLRVYAAHWAKFKAAFAELDNQTLHTIFIRHEEVDVPSEQEM